MIWDTSTNDNGNITGIYPGSLSIGNGVNLRVSGSGNGGAGVIYKNGLFLDTGDFTQSGGSINASGNNFGAGINLNSGDFTQSGGSINATGNGAYGIWLSNGNFTQSGGELFLMPGTGTVVLVAGQTQFKAGGTLRPGLDLASASSGGLGSGGNISIDPNARLVPHLINSLALQKGNSTAAMPFIQSGGQINNYFATVADTLTMRYTYDYSNPNSHYLSAQRAAWGSEVVSGENRGVLLAVERASGPNGLGLTGTPLNTAYSRIDESTSQGEADRAARGMTAWAATQLAASSIADLDMIGASLSKYIAQAANSGNGVKTLPAGGDNTDMAPAAGYTPLSTAWQAWLTPLFRYEKIDAKSGGADDLQGNRFGFSAGAARKFEGGTLGFSASFLHGDMWADGADIDSDTWGLMGAFRSAPLFSGSFSPWLQLTGGYAYTDYNLSRTDTLGVNHNASPDQHTFRAGLEVGQDFYVNNDALRLTPSIGLDYTYAHQSSYSEDGPSGLPLDVDSAHLDSLRGKVGLDAEYALCDTLSLGGYAYYRMEMADTHVDLDSRFVGTRIQFQTKGQDYDRSSGNIGLSADWTVTDQISTRAGYDFTLGDHYQGHQFDVSLIWEF